MKTDELTYFGIEKFEQGWVPAGIVGVPFTVHDALNTLREAVGSNLRIVIIRKDTANLWSSILKEKKILDYNSFLTAVKIFE